MATFPLFPTNATQTLNFDDLEDEDESSDSGNDIPLPPFDLDDDDANSDEGDYGDEDDQNSDDEDDLGPIPGGFADLGKLKGGFVPAMFGQPGNVRTTPAVTQPAAPLRLAVMPQAAQPPRPLGPVIPQAATAQPPRPLGPVIPQAATVQPPRPLGPAIPQATIAQPPRPLGPVIPQATVGVPPRPAPALGAVVPQVAKTAPALGPVIPQVAKPTAPALVAKPVTKGVDVNAILNKMPGISVLGVTPAPVQVSPDINNMIKQEADETAEDFEARRRLTLQLANIPDYKLNNSAAVTAGLIMMKKSKLGVKYDEDVEAAIAYLTSLLQR